MLLPLPPGGIGIADLPPSGAILDASGIECDIVDLPAAI